MIINIKTIPDIRAGRRLYGDFETMQTLSPKDVARVMQLQHDQHNPQQSNQLKPHLREIICISVIDLDAEKPIIQQWQAEQYTEQQMLALLQKALLKPACLQVWDNFNDLAIVQYRAFLQGISYQDFSTEYISINKTLPKTAAESIPANELAQLLNLPFCQLLNNEAVWQAYLQADMDKIYQACATETKMLATLLLTKRHQQNMITAAECQANISAFI